jgi:hypothetical protein
MGELLRFIMSLTHSEPERSVKFPARDIDRCQAAGADPEEGLMKEINSDALVIADAEGNYYVLPKELIEVSRIDQSANARVDEYLRAGSTTESADQADFSYLGSITLPAESKWTHFTPSVAWPNGGAPGRQHPGRMVMMDKPVIPASEPE